MKRSHLFGLTLLTALSVAADGAGAQTANSTPTAPASGGASTTGPSTGEVTPNAGTPKLDAPTPTEQAEQKKSDKDMNICKGC